MRKLVIGGLTSRKVLDSRGNFTIEVEVTVQDERGKKLALAKAAAPSGASKGKHEVIAFPKGGVEEAIEKIERLAKLKGADANQEKIDALLKELDGTPDLHELGGNATIAVSMAVAKAVSSARGMPLYEYLGGGRARELPYPLGNVIGGGKHARGGAPDIQEFLAVPVGAGSITEALSANALVHERAGVLIEAKDKTFTGGRGDEGAWAPNLSDLEALEILTKACREVGDEVGFEIRPALDIASSSIYDEKRSAYVYKRGSETRSRGEQIDFIVDLIQTHKLFYLEDPLQEEDFEGFVELTRRMGKQCLICGDDLFVTNVGRLRKGIKVGAANAVLIKPNQVGTLSDTLATVKLAKKHGYTPVMSHRSGETPDETIAHLAVAWRCPLIKTGVIGGERVAKLNELIRIEKELGKRAQMGELK